jgi:hypothetical protein
MRLAADRLDSIFDQEFALILGLREAADRIDQLEAGLPPYLNNETYINLHGTIDDQKARIEQLEDVLRTVQSSLEHLGMDAFADAPFLIRAVRAALAHHP